MPSTAAKRSAHSAAINPRMLPAIDQLLISGIKLGAAKKHEAINKILELVPSWTRAHCWRRIRQLRKTSDLRELEADRSGRIARRSPTPRRASQPWSEQDDDRLLNCAGYEPVKKIAQRLGRSESAIRYRMGALGMSAKVTDGWSQRALRKMLRLGPNRIRWLVGSGLLRVRDPRVTANSLAELLEPHRDSFDPSAIAQFAAARTNSEEGYSWERAADLLGVQVEQIQTLIASGVLKVIDGFVTERQFEEFCRKHGDEINLSLMDPATARWLVEEYGIATRAKEQTPSRVQKHVLKVRQCQCGKAIAGNAYFRHIRVCPSGLSSALAKPSRSVPANRAFSAAS